MVVCSSSGFGLLPIESTTLSTGMMNSDPSIGTGRARPESSGSPSSILTHLSPVTQPSFVAEDLDRVGQPVKLHTFLDRVLMLLDACGHFLVAAAVNDHALFSTDAQRDANRVHGRIASADNRDAPADHDGCVSIREIVGVHQVDARQELVGRVHAIQVLARDSHEAAAGRLRCRRRQPRSPFRPSVRPLRWSCR